MESRAEFVGHECLLEDKGEFPAHHQLRAAALKASWA